MKTKTFLMLCLLLGIGLTQLSAQDYPPPPQPPVVEGTKSVSWYGDYYFGEDLYCNGVYVESIFGPIIWHNISHFVNGVEVWETSHAKGEITSTSGEVFKINVTVKQANLENNIIWHGNLKGDMGSHYVYTMTSDLDWSNIIIEKSGCPGNKK